MPPSVDRPECWPSLPLDSWKDTCATLHMWTQIVGKARLALSPLVNHWWNVALYVTARGLTTSAMPHDGRLVQIDFDFLDHVLRIQMSNGAMKTLALVPRPVADFHAELMAVLHALGIDLSLYAVPVEIPDPIPFARDRTHAAYDTEH